MIQPPEKDIDYEDDDAAPRFRIGRVFAFLFDTLMFYRNVIMGAIVLGAISTWIYFLAIAKVNKKPEVIRIAESETPTLSIDIDASKPGISTDQTESEIAIPQGPASKTSDNSELQSLLERGNKEELLDYSIKVNDNWRQQTSMAACLMLNDRLKVTRHLMDMELTLTERTYVLISYIESVSVIDSLNTQKKLGLKGVREALIEVDKIYSNHELAPVSAKANLAFVIVPGYELVIAKHEDKIKEMIERLDQRGQFIFVDLKSTQQLCEVVLGIVRSRLFPDQSKALALNVLNRIEQLQDDRFDPLIQKFSEQIHFGDLEPNVLLGRIAINDSDTQQKVQSLFDGIEAAPNSRIEFYAAAVSFIRVYIQVGNLEAAERYLSQYRRSAARISDKDKREEVLKSASSLEKELLESQSGDSGK